MSKVQAEASLKEILEYAYQYADLNDDDALTDKIGEHEETIRTYFQSQNDVNDIDVADMDQQSSEALAALERIKQDNLNPHLGVRLIADKLSDIETIRTTLQRNDVPQWQPIDTAPDGTDILVWSKGYPVDKMFRNGEYWFHEMTGYAQKPWPIKPTHWMPLPSAPKQSGE